MLYGAVGRLSEGGIKLLKEGDELMANQIALIAGIAVRAILTIALPQSCQVIKYECTGSPLQWADDTFCLLDERHTAEPTDACTHREVE